MRRGNYAGAVGYFGYDGDMDLAIAIRTILLKDGVAHVQAGAGIVFDSVPERFRGRTLYRHNANVTLMRTTSDECLELGRTIGRKLAAARGPALILFPSRGVSAIDRAGQPFDDPAAREALRRGLEETRGAVPLVELDLHLNDEAFADRAADELLARMSTRADIRS